MRTKFLMGVLICLLCVPLAAQNKTTVVKPKKTNTLKPKPIPKADLVIKEAWYGASAPNIGYVLEVYPIYTDVIIVKNLYCNGYKEKIDAYFCEKKYSRAAARMQIVIPLIGSEDHPEYPIGDTPAPIAYTGKVLIEYEINGKLKYLSVPEKAFKRMKASTGASRAN